MNKQYIKLIYIKQKINQDLSYDDSLSDGPGAWLVKKIFFYMHAITKLKKRPHIEIQNGFQNKFCFYYSLHGL